MSMIPLGVLASARVASSGGWVTVLHDAPTCGVTHTVDQHDQAGHMLTGTWDGRAVNGVRVEMHGGFACNSSYSNLYLIQRIGPDVRVSTRIFGLHLLQDRRYGLAARASEVTYDSSVVKVHMNSTQVIVVGDSVSTTYTVPPREEADLALEVVGDTATVVLDGETIHVGPAGPGAGDYAGIHATRGFWVADRGWRHILIEQPEA